MFRTTCHRPRSARSPPHCFFGSVYFSGFGGDGLSSSTSSFLKSSRPRSGSSADSVGKTWQMRKSIPTTLLKKVIAWSAGAFPSSRTTPAPSCFGRAREPASQAPQRGIGVRRQIRLEWFQEG